MGFESPLLHEVKTCGGLMMASDPGFHPGAREFDSHLPLEAGPYSFRQPQWMCPATQATLTAKGGQLKHYAVVEIEKARYRLVTSSPMPSNPADITWWGCVMCRSFHTPDGKFYARIDFQCEAHKHVISQPKEVSQ